MARERFSIAALMAIVAIAALNLMVYRGFGHRLAISPFFLALLTIDIGLYRILVRRRSGSRKLLGMMIGGTTAVALSLLYLLYSYQNMMRDVGGIARLIQSNDFIPLWIRSSVDNAMILEFLVLDAPGIAVILAGGWLAGRGLGHDPDRPAEPKSPVTAS